MINKYGLFKTSVERWGIPGLKSDRFDSQTQGWWLPMADKNGDIHMVDTYHISSGIFNYQDPIKTIVDNVDSDKDYTRVIGKSNWDYYYGGSVKITKQTEQYFVEACDLRDFEIVSGNTDDYLAKDKVTHVQFFFEHNYPCGVTLLRKGAKKDPGKIVDNCCDEILDQARNSDYISTWKIDDAKQAAIDSGDETLINKMANLEALINKVKAMNAMRRRFIDEFRYGKPKTNKVFTVIAFAGKAGVGKSTVANVFKSCMNSNNPYNNNSIQIIPFAKEIKIQAKILGWDGNKDEKGRKLLQDITKPIKAYHGQNHYAEVVFEEALRCNPDFLVIDDLRFKVEANFLKEKAEEGKCKVIFVKVENKNLVSGLTKEAQADVSENDLNDFKFDYVIDNSSTMDNLKVEVENFIETTKIRGTVSLSD